jgi:hypothetical protein
MEVSELKLINLFISASTVLVRTLAASNGRFRNVFRYMGGLRWTSDQPVAKASTSTDNTTQRYEDKRPCLKRDPNPRSQRPSDQGLRLRPRGRWDRQLKYKALFVKRGVVQAPFGFSGCTSISNDRKQAKYENNQQSGNSVSKNVVDGFIVR